MNLIPVVIAFGEIPIVFQIIDARAKAGILTNDSRLHCTHDLEAVLAKDLFKLSDRSHASNCSNIIPERSRCIRNKGLKCPEVAGSNEKVDNVRRRQLLRNGPTQYHVADAFSRFDAQ